MVSFAPFAQPLLTATSTSRSAPTTNTHTEGLQNHPKSKNTEAEPTALPLTSAVASATTTNNAQPLQHSLALVANPVADSTAAFNGAVLGIIKRMPKSGRYSVSSKANANLRRAISLDEVGNLAVDPHHATPSFCSGATYLVFLMALQELEKNGAIKLSKKTNEAFLHKSQPDGAGIWGRWNANGPGVARLVHELNAGDNFQEISNAQPGDFLKIWWNEEIGAKEKGHLVIYLGQRTEESGEKMLCFWSSNMPDGYGAKEIPLSKAKRMLFSRMTRPEAFAQVLKLPQKDDFLASMLSKSFTIHQVLNMTGAQP